VFASLTSDPNFDLSSRREDESVVVAVTGEVDFTTVPQLREAVDAALDTGENVVLDLAAMSFIDTMGLGVLIQAHKRSEPDADALVLRSPQRNVRRALEVAGLDGYFTIED
jgi:anti-anti-sigma factor